MIVAHTLFARHEHVHFRDAGSHPGAATHGSGPASTLRNFQYHKLRAIHWGRKSADPAKELAKVELLLVTVSELVFDGEAAREAEPHSRPLLESQGCMIGPYDVLLAGHARFASLTLVTANTARVQPAAWLEAGRPAPGGHMNLSKDKSESPEQSGLRGSSRQGAKKTTGYAVCVTGFSIKADSPPDFLDRLLRFRRGG